MKLNIEIINDPLAERYYNIIKEKVKEDYYWEQKVKNLISRGQIGNSLRNFEIKVE